MVCTASSCTLMLTLVDKNFFGISLLNLYSSSLKPLSCHCTLPCAHVLTTPVCRNHMGVGVTDFPHENLPQPGAKA